jgi:hypothetical protein
MGSDGERCRSQAGAQHPRSASIEADHGLILYSLFEHDPFREPVSTFRDHALEHRETDLATWKKGTAATTGMVVYINIDRVQAIFREATSEGTTVRFDKDNTIAIVEQPDKFLQAPAFSTTTIVSSR